MNLGLVASQVTTDLQCNKIVMGLHLRVACHLDVMVSIETDVTFTVGETCRHIAASIRHAVLVVDLVIRRQGRDKFMLWAKTKATGKLEDRFLDDVVYTVNAKINIISLGYLQTTGRYKLTCSPDQQTAWLSKPDTTLKFTMHDNIYRLRAELVTGVMVMAAMKQEMDSKKSMELLHQRFGHMSMDTIKVLSKKLDVGIKINENGLRPYECVACAASTAKRMTYSRVPVRKSDPLEKVMVDIYSMSELTVDGATMFLFIVDEVTRFKWAFMLKAESEATWHIKVIVNQLNTRFPDRNVRRLHSDQGGEFLDNELAEYCAQLSIKLTTTNAYSPQENGIVERANGIVLPRIRATLTATHLPNSLWGEALLHVVTMLNNLPTKPLGLVSPHQRLWKEEPMLDDLRTWGWLAHVRIPPESRQKKEKL
ncbi:Integrase, catalytic core protein [Phytophthora megakarya]|uniref:Integrase, catalytic core protein n=1 Tax=Phytophthora megakarya TaxID=4795 RepID=A0A225UN35_9STRA|nr:Integrase, catalytic core protein [Phytophthora megakarya]